MNIGILTYHRTLNYGACLQSLATRIVLEDMGHKVYYIDYWPEYHQRLYKPFSWNKLTTLSLKGKIKYILKTICCYKYRKERNSNFVDFQNKFIIPYCRPLSDEYDVVIYGSDQIWRKQKEIGAYDPIYFTSNKIKSKKHVAFSASMGVLPSSIADMQMIKSLLCNFDNIAVREKDLSSLLISLGYINVSLTLDPTLLLSAKKWDSLIETTPYNGQKYILVYGIGKTFDMKEVQKFAKMHSCSVKVLYMDATSRSTENAITTAGPNVFIKLIKNAEYIFTSSFHGLAFSIIYEKEFYASYRNNSNRAETLLDAAGINGRIIPPNAAIPILDQIDYVSVKNKLQQHINDSTLFLRSSLVQRI